MAHETSMKALNSYCKILYLHPIYLFTPLLNWYFTDMVSCEGWLQTAFTVYEFKLCLCTPEAIEASQRSRVRGYTLNHWPQLTAPKNFIGDNHIHQRVWVLELRRRQTKQKSTFCVVVLPFYTPWSSPKPPLRYRLGRASVLEASTIVCGQTVRNVRHCQRVDLHWNCL